jgi:hypothetical protein
VSISRRNLFKAGAAGLLLPNTLGSSLLASPVGPDCISSGFPKFDQYLGGGYKKGVYLVGNSILAGEGNFGINGILTAAKQDRNVLFLSNSDLRHKVATKLLSMESGIDYHYIRNGCLDDEGLQKFSDASREILRRGDFISVKHLGDLLSISKACQARPNQDRLGLAIIHTFESLDFTGLPHSFRSKERGRDVLEHLKDISENSNMAILLLTDSEGFEFCDEVNPFIVSRIKPKTLRSLDQYLNGYIRLVKANHNTPVSEVSDCFLRLVTQNGTKSVLVKANSATGRMVQGIPGIVS